MRTTQLRGARTHNLKDVDLDLEPGSLVAVVGPSGAGKSSLAFSTLYAEGQRRYVESFSAYARQFLERLSRPPVTSLEPVPVGIAVDRQAPVRTSRSTVGTMTEIADYVKSLWAHAAELKCPGCGQDVHRDTAGRAAQKVISQWQDQRLVVTYPVRVSDAEDFVGVREALVQDGYRRVRLGDKVEDLDSVRPSDVLNGGGRTLHVVADRAVAKASSRNRLIEAFEAGFRRGNGRAEAWRPEGDALTFSKGLSCAACDTTYREPTPGLFSFNSPVGACETCRGFGRTIEIDFDKVLPDDSLTLAEGAIRAWTGKATQWERRELKKHAKTGGVPLDVPLRDLSPEQHAWLIEGDELGYPKGWWGIRGWFGWMESRAYKMHVRVFLSRYRKYEPCSDCQGTRLKDYARAWHLDGETLPGFYARPAESALTFLRDRETRFADDPGVSLLWREAVQRLSALADVGLGYLSLDRPSRTLSGGESQRVALTSALGATLNGAMFVLDEPTVGLHPADVEKLLGVVTKLTRGDNVAVVVEHDATMIRGADRVIELGPGAGERGGTIVFDGTPARLAKAQTLTGESLREAGVVDRPRKRSRAKLSLKGASGHNLVGVDVSFPVGALSCVTGVSGSGKSTLVLQTLVPAVAEALGKPTKERPLPHAKLSGAQHLNDVLAVDQAPLGRTSRGNPATYLKLWDVLRKRLTAQPIAKARGYKPGFFSFNVAGGRCEACRGEGAETVEMQFLADVSFTCPECQGRRFVGDVLDVTYHDKNAAELLAMTAAEVAEHFASDAAIARAIKPLCDVGLGYLKLGQPLNTLSGGEAQRLKLAEALVRSTPGSLIVLDEPTAGLHSVDIAPLLNVLDALVERGDTVIVVEHEMRVAAHADYVVDLGPGAGLKGGRVVGHGTPEGLTEVAESITASHLRKALQARRPRRTNKRVRAKRTKKSDGAITISGAREHNLQNVEVSIPRDKLVAVTGPSGSGKSTLAFDVLFAEGQRRYLETLSPYARQYMPQLPRPAVDQVIGVPPAVSLEQRVTRAGANSTVATVTEVSHYLRLLWARVGTIYCLDCDVPIAPRSLKQLARDAAKQFGSRAKVTLLSPVVRGRKGIHRDLLNKAQKDGITEARIDGEWVNLKPGMKLDRYVEHDVDLVIGRLKTNEPSFEATLADALHRGDGAAEILKGDKSTLMSTKRACPKCSRGYPELDPRFFSFNTRQGQCPKCEGRGEIVKKKWRGRRRRRAEERSLCTACDQTRLSPLARNVRIDGKPITGVLGKSVTAARQHLKKLKLSERDATIAKAPLGEVQRRLAFVEEVGLGYLGLDRAARTLSGGEMQRVRLAAQLGSGLTGVLYVLDEPTIGLHPRDTGQLLKALRGLVDRGNSVVVVEHDAETIMAADHVLDIGPGGGRHGGTIVANDIPSAAKTSTTLVAIHRPPPVPERRRPTKSAPKLLLEGASQHNLRAVDLSLPLERLVLVTGVSGSGKSTLVRDVLLRATRDALGLVNDKPVGAHERLKGFESLKRAIEIDQSPIGRTPRSVPATYIGVWDEIRKLLAGTPDARARGYGPGRFSFNTEEGRCPECKGQGAITVKMSFLPDVLVPCERCSGLRFTPETLDVRWRGRSAGEILQLEVRDAVDFFEPVPFVRKPLALMNDLGLGYLALGQASNTLSGGEAQRMKLVSELAVGDSAGRGLYVMDEPTTGLHRDDVVRLLDVLQRLVDRGDSVVVIEHHPDVMLAADWIVDLGPEGGEGGGTIVASGAPETIAKRKRSHTGKVLAQELAKLG